MATINEEIAKACEPLAAFVRDYGRRAGDDDALLAAEQQPDPRIAQAMVFLDRQGVTL